MRSVFKHLLKSNLSLIGKLMGCLAPLCCLTCTSPVDIAPGGFTPSLVVEGFISDDVGPHEIRITRIGKFTNVLRGGAIERVEASVNIIDDVGNRIPMERREVVRKDIFNNPPGCAPSVALVTVRTNYLTPDDFQAQLGRTYTLEIIVDDQIYRSEPQTIIPTPEIDSLRVIFQEIPTLNEFVPDSGFDIIASWKDDPGDDFYTWRINGIYRIATPQQPAPACCLFDPRDGGEDDCWILENDIEDNVAALSDRFFNGQVATEKVGFIKDDGLRFASELVPGDKQYYVQVEQYRISEEAFNFYENIDIIASIDGEIFDPPPLGIRGNITNMADPEELVIGFFGAFSAQKKDVFISRSEVPFTQRFPRPCGDCRVRAGAQVEIPEPYK
ncbi:MAG: DUF4249 domain-containing protein [Bacteroidota bacterium]